MATQLLHITKTVCITPLVEIHNLAFHEWYRKGVHWCHHEREGTGPLPDRYLADGLLNQIELGHFDGQHVVDLYRWIGFGLGMIHGGILQPDGTRRPDVTMLVTFYDKTTLRGYNAGRRFFFLDADTDEERTFTDVGLIESIETLAAEQMGDRADTPSWYFGIGDILGQLSGRIFPWTREEHHTFERDSLKEVGYVCNLPQGCLATRLFAPVVTS